MKEAYCHICGCFNDQAGYRKICTKCTTNVTKYNKYLREGSQVPEHLELIDYLNRIFAVNSIEGKYVHKVFYTHGGGSDGFTKHEYNYSEPEYTYLTSETGKRYKLRKGSMCRKCGVELNELNWSLGNGNICKSCINEYYRARRKGVWSW